MKIDMKIKQDRNNTNDRQKKHRLGTVSKNNLLEGFQSTFLTFKILTRLC